MMEAFYTTSGIVFGILLPVILVALYVQGTVLIKSIPIWLEEKLETIKKAPPYDEVRTYYDIKNRRVVIDIFKKDQWVGTGFITDKELRER